MRRTFRTWLSVFTLMAFLLAACAPAATPAPQATQPPAQQATNTPAPTPATAPTTGGGLVIAEGNVKLPEIDPADYSGDIITMGSSTVFPLSERMAERFEAEGFAGRITIDSIGSGAGYERFCVAGESDIANASRPIRESERESCRAIGREAIEFRVGTDALAVVVSAENDFVTNLTMEQLALVFSSAASWSEVDPSFPDQPILRFIPGTDSGTFDYFVEEVFDSNQEPILNAANLQLSEDDNILVQGILGSPYAVGFFGFAYYVENVGRLKTVAIDSIEPTEETAESGEYPLARPLFIYSDASILQAKPQVAAFINFYLTFVNEEVIDVGYFPASVDALDGARTAWLNAMAMEVAMPPTTDMVILPEVDPAEFSGDIITMGSSTVFPLSERMAERFEAEGFAGRITIDSIGSGAGYERFCVAGESDIANASRPIRESERESCRAIGREAIEFRVGTDALAVVVSAENDFVTNLTMEQLALVFSSAASWSEVDPSFPDQPILRFIPGTDSGTFDYFVEEVFDSNQEPILNAANLQLSEDDNILVQGILGSPYAVGFFGFAYYVENVGRLKTVAIDSIEPTEETAESGEYPLARPLFIYSDASILQAKPQVAAFINFYLTFVNEEVIDVGYFPASDQALNAARQAWLDAMQ
jgi:phosphate transport system substrate-binding protein